MPEPTGKARLYKTSRGGGAPRHVYRTVLRCRGNSRVMTI